MGSGLSSDHEVCLEMGECAPTAGEEGDPCRAKEGNALQGVAMAVNAGGDAFSGGEGSALGVGNALGVGSGDARGSLEAERLAVGDGDDASLVKEAKVLAVSVSGGVGERIGRSTSSAGATAVLAVGDGDEACLVREAKVLAVSVGGGVGQRVGRSASCAGLAAACCSWTAT